jgi:hypothetical protein
MDISLNTKKNKQKACGSSGEISRFPIDFISYELIEDALLLHVLRIDDAQVTFRMRLETERLERRETKREKEKELKQVMTQCDTDTAQEESEDISVNTFVDNSSGLVTRFSFTSSRCPRIQL